MVSDSTIHDYLKKYFGFDTFKGNQEGIIKNILDYTFLVTFKCIKTKILL